MDHKQDLYNIGQVLNGNVNAFANIVERHKDNAFNLAFRICGNREEAEEVTQDSFVKAFRSLEQFKMKSSFSTWLFRIVYNTSISEVRRRKKTILSIDDFPAEISDFADNSSESESAEREYRIALVNFALQKIGDEERALVSLFYYEDLSVEEIANITGISKSNVKVRLFRARQKMMGIIKRSISKNLIYHE